MSALATAPQGDGPRRGSLVKLSEADVIGIKNHLGGATFQFSLVGEPQFTPNAPCPNGFRVELVPVENDLKSYTLFLRLAAPLDKSVDITELGAKIQKLGGNQESFVLSTIEKGCRQLFLQLQWGESYQIYFDTGAPVGAKLTQAPKEDLRAHAR